MSDKQYWLRMKDKVYGPYDASTIRQIAGAGTLRREMEISSDKSAWHVAGSVQGLFPQKTLNDFAPSPLPPQPSPISGADHVESVSTASAPPSSVTATAAEEGGGTKLGAWIGVGIAAVILFYLGGGEIVWNRPWLSLAFTRGFGNILADGFTIADRLLAVRFNDGIYGLEIVPRFFDSPILSWALVGGSGMCLGDFFRRM